MPRKAKDRLHFVYMVDMAGLWLFLTDGQNKTLVTPVPIVRQEAIDKIVEACKEVRE